MNNFLGTISRVLDFKQINNVRGKNGSGKSSIKEAIIFALYGKINWQEKLIEGAYTNGADSTLVVLEVEYKGEKYIVERSRDIKGSTSLKINGKSTSQDGINLVFDNYDIFVSAFSVGDFMKLDEETRYEILSSLFPDTREKIYEDMVGKEVAAKYPFNHTKLEEIKKQIKTIETDSDTIRANKILKSEQINTLRQMVAPTTDVTEDIIALKRQTLLDHEATKPKMSSETKTSTPEIDLLRGTIASERVSLRRFEETKPSREKIDELKTRWAIANAEAESVGVTGSCPTCNRAYDSNELERKKTIAKEKADGILAEGKIMRAEYDAELMGYEQELLNKQNDLRKQEEKLDELTKNLLGSQSGDVDYFNKQHDAWDARRRELEADLNEYSAKFREYQVRKVDFDSTQDKIEKIQKELGELDKQNGNADILSLEKVKEALSPKGVEFAEIQSKLDQILEYFPEGTEIELLRKNKTNDEYKKVFSVSVNGVNYNWLSKGMKKVFDIYVAEMIGNQLGIECLCIDDNESLTSWVQLTNTEKQVIILTARDEDFTFEAK